MRFFFASKTKGQKIDQATAEIMELHGQKKALQIEIEQIQLKLKNESQRSSEFALAHSTASFILDFGIPSFFRVVKLSSKTDAQLPPNCTLK